MTSADQDFATLQAFIVGRLSDDERRAFEDRLVREPRLVVELEQSLQLREGLQQLRTRGHLDRSASRRASFRTWAPALAAAAIAGLALFLWVGRMPRPAPILLASLESSAATNITRSAAAHFTFISVRGGLAPDLDAPAGGLIEIRAAPGMRQPAERYRVTLVRQPDGGPAETIAELAALALNDDGYVRCYADAARLPAGSYVLRIQPDTDTAGSAQAYPFNLRAHANVAPR